MTDIVARLRDAHSFLRDPLLKDAFETIEALRAHECSYDVSTDICTAYEPTVERLARERNEAHAVAERLRAHFSAHAATIQKQSDEIERLRAALREVISVSDRKTDIYDRAKAVLAGEKADG